MLIPRVRPSYTFTEVIKSLLVSDRGKKYSEEAKRLLSEYFGTENLMLTSSGRGSLYWILKTLPQTKVIVPAYTCIVVVEAAQLAGKTVLFENTDYDTFNTDWFGDVDSDTIVVATHQYGLPCKILEIVEYCHKKGAIVIEDSAAAFGSMIDGVPVGCFGDYSFFSFDPSKLICVPPKGGLIITRNKEDLRKIQEIYRVENCSLQYKMSCIAEGFIYCLLKNKFLYGLFHYFTMGIRGKMQLQEHNAPELKLTDFYTHGFYEWQAYILFRQLLKLNSIIDKRKKVFKYYMHNINNCAVCKPTMNENAVQIRYSIKVKEKKRVYETCIKRGVDLGFSFNYIAAPDDYKEEHRIANEVMNIPFYYEISEKEMKKVVKVINSITDR